MDEFPINPNRRNAMTRQAQQRTTINAHQIARMIDANINGYPSMAEAFIDVIGAYDLTDGAAVYLYRDTLRIKQANKGSEWLLAG
jgi:hypothetical protein